MTDIMPTNDDQQKGISLTLSQETFSDIILSFLGTKEKLQYITNDQFILRHNDIEQFYHLIEQKISKEKNIHISHFSLSIIYDDRTAREINGIDGVSKFLETRDVMPANIILSWNILVSFPNSKSVENQKVDLAFSIKNENSFQKKYYGGDIFLNIHHTNQAWGIEILNLLRDKIVSITNKEKLQSTIAKKILNLGVSNFLNIIITLFFILSLTMIFSAENNKSTIVYSPEVFNALKKSDNEKDSILILAMLATDKDFSLYAENKDVQSKLSNFFTEKAKNKKLAIYIIIGSIIGIIFLVISIIWYCKTTVEYYSSGSYILITRRAEKEYEQERDDRNKFVFWSVTLFTGSIICSIIASFIYTFLIS